MKGAYLKICKLSNYERCPSENMAAYLKIKNIQCVKIHSWKYINSNIDWYLPKEDS